MATGKNSFILYKDIRTTICKLPLEKRGELFTMILDYVNDLNPVTDDLVLDVAFEPIKQQLKRDLRIWDEKREKRVDAGRLGGIKSAEIRKQNEANEANATFSKQNEANQAVSVIVTGSVIGIEKEEERQEPIISKFNFKKSLIDLGIDKNIASDWLSVRKEKKASNTETAFNSIKREIDKCTLSPNECITIAVERSWSGFHADWIQQKDIKANNQQQTPNERMCSYMIPGGEKQGTVSEYEADKLKFGENCQFNMYK